MNVSHVQDRHHPISFKQSPGIIQVQGEEQVQSAGVPSNYTGQERRRFPQEGDWNSINYYFPIPLNGQL
ncbi:hypothetical protein HOLleu_01103 [Holothuria leucospilota]|uniref:Uncharacterized protein n=1 Tax=Holothuria leucospilota TaxID=206669 RepID=A0A9Q1HK29_HOLLE|nr:hypothetical protein HOLleu_01103 [Holothuria leucospilota]